MLAATVAGLVVLAIHAAGFLSENMVRPLPQWEFGLAAIPLGIAVGRCLAIPSRGAQRRLLVAISLTIVIEWQVLSLLGFGARALPYGLGIAMVCLAYCLEIRSDIVVASLAPLTFGVYLIHPLAAYALRHSPLRNGHSAASILLTVCISALVASVLMRTPFRRFV